MRPVWAGEIEGTFKESVRAAGAGCCHSGVQMKEKPESPKSVDRTKTHYYTSQMIKKWFALYVTFPYRQQLLSN